MNEKELRELLRQLEKSGWQAEVCDTPIPYFTNGVPAGYPETPGDYDGEMVLVPRSFLKDCDFILSVHGDSMKDADILDGDDVIVKSSEGFDDGDIVVAFLDGDTTLKAFYRDEHGEAWLVPANDSYKPIRVADYATAYVLGTVTGVRRRAVRLSYNAIQRRLRESRQQERKELTDDVVRDCITQVLNDIKNGRMWFSVYRVLADAGYIHKGRYEELRTKMDELFPDNDFNINAKDIARLDVLSFQKNYSLWYEQNAPVTGKRFRDYLHLAADLTALLNA